MSVIGRSKTTWRSKHHGGSRDLERSVGSLDFFCTFLNSSHRLVLLISIPTELGGRERDRLLGLSSLVAWKDDFDRVGLGSRTLRLRLRGGNLPRTGLLSLVAAKEDWERVGLGSRVLGPEYLGRGVLVAVSERGLLVRRLAIPTPAPNGLDSTGGIDRLGPASDESVTDPSVLVVR